MQNEETNPRMNVVWGARAIGKVINLSARQTFHMLETGKLPARKVGDRWCAEEGKLREFITGE